MQKETKFLYGKEENFCENTGLSVIKVATFITGDIEG